MAIDPVCTGFICLFNLFRGRMYPVAKTMQSIRSILSINEKVLPAGMIDICCLRDIRRYCRWITNDPTNDK